MADYNSELPIRSQLPGQVLSDDVIIKIGDATNPTAQMASVDVHGSLQSRIADAAGDIIGSQDLSTSYWLQIVAPSNGPATPGAAAVYAGLIAGVYNSVLPDLSNGQQSALQVNDNGVLLTSPVTDLAPGGQPITAEDTASTSTTVANGQVFVTGTPTTGSYADYLLNTQESVRISVTGTWTGTLVVEQSMDDGTTWIMSNVHQIGTAYTTNNFTENFIGGVNVAGATNIRIRATAPWTGTAGTIIIESVNAFSTYIANPIKLVDQSTNTELNIKPASTAAATTDTSAVVALSPNSPVPAGTNLIGGATVYVGSSPATVSNPVPVTITSASAGTPIQNYMTSVALAAGSSATLTYTVPAGHTFSLERIWASASGKIKVVVQNGSTTIYAAFNSTANPNVDITVTAPPTIAAAGTVNVIITNEDKAAFDVYATVEGNQIT